jgi:hypothetical protein
MIFVYDLSAKETKTELEINQGIFSEKSDQEKELSNLDIVGNSLFLQPVEAVKEGTEEYILLRMGKITHDDMENTLQQKNSLFEHKADGPKISVTF